MPQQTELIERLRGQLVDEPTKREVSMFGGRSIMINEKMIVSALKDGGLLVRVDPYRHDELLSRGGAVRAEMGSGREMGAGWIEVAAGSIGNDEELSFWVDAALEYNRIAVRKSQ